MVASSIVDALIATGTVFQTILDTIAPVSQRHVWGVMGDAINPLADALRTDDRFEWMHIRHEEVAAFAVGAQAKLNGKLVFAQAP